MKALAWLTLHKWRMLLATLIALLIVSPVTRVFEDQDNLISPLFTLVLGLVVIGAAERRERHWLLLALVVTWGAVSFATDGSGLFAGISLLAPVLFLFVLAAIFVLIARWMFRAEHINAEVLCAAICGYLLLGVFWAVLYSIILVIRARWFPNHPIAFVSTVNDAFEPGDLLYFSYMTLTTTGYGDIVPRGSEVRMFAVLEAMVGLFYNTIIIARFVSLYGSHFYSAVESRGSSEADRDT